MKRSWQNQHFGGRYFNSGGHREPNKFEKNWSNQKRLHIDQSDLTEPVADSNSNDFIMSSRNSRGHSSNEKRNRFKSSTFAHVSNSNRNNDLNYSRVSQAMWDYFSGNCQSFECFNRKVQLKETIHQILCETLPYIGVYIVGSSANGFGTNQSDVDICLMISEHEIDQKTEAIQILKAFCRSLKKAQFIQSIQVIQAKVPIIKFHDAHNGLDCDINLNNHIGIRNTHLMKAYSEQDWRVRPLILTVKKWAKFHNINDASQATISSYSLVLMTIYYLQAVCKPPVLPVLQENYPEKFDINIPVDELKLNEKLPTFTSQNSSSLGELFFGFLEFYSKFNFRLNIISVRKGQIFARNTLPWEETNSRYSQWKYILIEEPFDLSNTARSVHDEFIFDKIINVFHSSKKRLEEVGSLNCLFRDKFYEDKRYNYSDDDGF